LKDTIPQKESYGNGLVFSGTGLSVSLMLLVNGFGNRRERKQYEILIGRPQE